MRELFVVDRPTAFFSREGQPLQGAPTRCLFRRALPDPSMPSSPSAGCPGPRASRDEGNRDRLCCEGASAGTVTVGERALARALRGFYWAGWPWGWSYRGPAAVWVTSHGLALRRHVSRRLARIPAGAIRTIEVHDSSPGPVGVAPLLCVTWSDGNDLRESAFAVSGSPVETRRWGETLHSVATDPLALLVTTAPSKPLKPPDR